MTQIWIDLEISNPNNKNKKVDLTEKSWGKRSLDSDKSCRLRKIRTTDTQLHSPADSLDLLAGIFHLLRTARCSTGLNGSDPEQMEDIGWRLSLDAVDIWNTRLWQFTCVLAKISTRNKSKQPIAAATILPKFLKFWTPAHDFALVIESFELLVCVLIFNDYKSLTLDQGSDFNCIGVHGKLQLLSLFLLVDQTTCLCCGHRCGSMTESLSDVVLNSCLKHLSH